MGIIDKILGNPEQKAVVTKVGELHARWTIHEQNWIGLVSLANWWNENAKNLPAMEAAQRSEELVNMALTFSSGIMKDYPSLMETALHGEDAVIAYEHLKTRRFELAPPLPVNVPAAEPVAPTPAPAPEASPAPAAPPAPTPAAPVTNPVITQLGEFLKNNPNATQEQIEAEMKKVFKR